MTTPETSTQEWFATWLSANKRLKQAEHHTTPPPLTSVEVQLLSRSRLYNQALWTDGGRYLVTDNPQPQVELEAAQSLTEKGYLTVTYTNADATWYELTPLGLAYFNATWPNRRD